MNQFVSVFIVIIILINPLLMMGILGEENLE